LVTRKENEGLDSLLKRFKLWVADAGIMDEIRKREFYQSKSIKRKNKSKRARKRLLKENRM
jgi:ribosomal protein S21